MDTTTKPNTGQLLRSLAGIDLPRIPLVHVLADEQLATALGLDPHAIKEGKAGDDATIELHELLTILADNDQAEQRKQAGQIIHDMLRGLPPGSWPEPDAHGIQALRRMAADARKPDDRPPAVVVECAGGYLSRDCNITLGDGTPIGHMVRKATLTIEGGEPNVLVLETLSPAVVAQVFTHHMVMDWEDSLADLRKFIWGLVPDGDDEGLALSEAKAVMDMLDEGIKTAKALMRNPRMVYEGRTLWAYCEEFGITDAETIAKAEDINMTEPHGLRVFPTGDAGNARWMCVPPDSTGNPVEDRLAWGPTPGAAVINWAKEFDTEEASGLPVVKIGRKEASALMSLFMASDPTPLEDADDGRVKDLADRIARAFGYDNWIVALHELPKDIDQGGRGGVVPMPGGAVRQPGCLVPARSGGVRLMRMVTVCSACRRACCWQGQFMCDDARTAGTIEVPIEELQAAGQEHPDYWE